MPIENCQQKNLLHHRKKHLLKILKALGNDADSSSMEDTQEVTATDIQEFKDYLETLHFDVWTMLFTLWGFAWYIP